MARRLPCVPPTPTFATQCEHGVINVTNAFYGRDDRTSCLFAHMNWGYGGFCGACFTNCSAGECGVSAELLTVMMVSVEALCGMMVVMVIYNSMTANVTQSQWMFY